MREVSNTRILVVGGGLGAFRVVEQLRRKGSAAEITVLAGEAHLPYDRPPLSKQLLRGEIETTQFPGIADLDANWLVSTRAVSLDLGVRTIGTGDGRTWPYDILILAPGGRARSLPNLQAGQGVHALRTIEDAYAMRASLTPGKRLIVIGGGFIGCEIAASARHLGVAVDVIEALPAPLLRVLGPLGAEKVEALHRSNGVGIHTRASVEQALRDASGAFCGVRLDDSSQIVGDTVVVGIGMEPEIEWLAGSGLKLDKGIVCDASGQTSAENVYALGDAAQWWHDLAGQHRRVEHWTSTADQAATIAANIARATSDPVTMLTAAPYFWSDQFNVKIQGIGFVDPADEVTELTMRDRTVLLYSREGIVRAVVGFSIPGAVMRMKPLIERHATIEDAIGLLQP